ncbi:hypothetical protein EHS25_009416 [Saitozyma podzolica]|uniref:Uncharacterized protein n=1 Tax=Saitozyma podzolica TaxID=1890683 RepID=A0A427YLS9_9TREE|nr:hypothetical protein EHS25_009416 [Saitozyma podzolica]
MAAALTLKPSHPALLTQIPTPPATPTSPITTSRSYPVVPQSGPVVDYALLRSHHAYSLRYVIAKLRWEQANNDYIRGEDAWLNHNRMIAKLETELRDCEEARKGLDKFPDFCFAPIAFPKPHGPLSKEQFEAEKKRTANKEKELDAQLEKQFPFIKKLFIGPMTKQQARNDKLLREQLKEGDFEDLDALLPSENLRMAMRGNKVAGAEKEQKPKDKRPYEAIRLEKEKAKIDAMLGTSPAPPKKVTPAPKIGPVTREEYIASLPVEGPKNKGDALLPVQREQRHAILTFLRRPWPAFDEEAAGLMEKLGRLAVKRLNDEVKKHDKASRDGEAKKEA